MSTPTAPATPKRQLRNFLLDSRFQLKFTGYALMIALTVAALLGGFLWTTAQELAREAEIAVEARSQAAQASKELSSAALSTEVLAHFDDPGFEERLKQRARELDARYEAERAQVMVQRTKLNDRQRILWWVLAGCMVVFVLAVAAATLVITHRIVGPVYRIKRLVHEVAEGRLEAQTRSLRKGDELQELFGAVATMIQKLRERRMEEVARVDQLLARARRGEGSALLSELEALKAKLESSLR